MSNSAVAIDNRPRRFNGERFLTLWASILYLADYALENFGLYDLKWNRPKKSRPPTVVPLTGVEGTPTIGQVYPAIAAQIQGAEAAARLVFGPK
jgi:hypothetical protein